MHGGEVASSLKGRNEREAERLVWYRGRHGKEEAACMHVTGTGEEERLSGHAALCSAVPDFMLAAVVHDTWHLTVGMVLWAVLNLPTSVLACRCSQPHVTSQGCR